MAYTTVDNPTAYFNTNLIPSASEITSVGHQADWIWLKSRNNSYSHEAIDTVRGINKKFKVDTTSAESTDANIITAIGSDSYTVGSSSNAIYNSGNGVGWSWKAGGSASSNSNGSITSSVSANTTAGFSIATYTGTGSNANVGHGLSSAPQLIITKSRSTTGDWKVHTSAIDGSWDVGTLNSTSAFGNSSYTAPTSSIFYVGSGAPTNASSVTYVSYLLHSVKGYSKFGSYAANGNADGPFIHTGFRPAFIINKRTDSTSGWDIFDNKRLGYNVANRLLGANSNGAESTTDKLDILSNGFKMRTTSGGNYSGATYIYMAFAESPFVNSNGVPNNAR
jgi:hypothetical protein